MIFPGLAGAVLFLLGGMAFSYWIILPASLRFLLSIGGDEFKPLIHSDQYMSFATRIIVGVGLAFELPIVLALAARLRLIRARQLLGFWRYAIVVIFIIAAVITPSPDPGTQMVVAVPLLILYEIGVLLSRIA